jgi:putative ABC transport system ATP-binding protein
MLLELCGVTKTFPGARGGRAALVSVDLRVERGESLSVVGRSGSGKSTLLHMLTGIDRPTSGSVRARDARPEGEETIDLCVQSESALARWRRRNVGVVFQFFQLMPTLTVAENVGLAMDLAAVVPRARRRGRVVAILERVGLASLADALPSEISGGEQQRAAIARALANDPPLIVADEPTGNLDGATAQAMLKLFDELAAEGRTLVVVTHDQAVSTRFPRIVTLEDGRVASDVRRAHVARGAA